VVLMQCYPSETTNLTELQTEHGSFSTNRLKVQGGSLKSGTCIRNLFEIVIVHEKQHSENGNKMPIFCQLWL